MTGLIHPQGGVVQREATQAVMREVQALHREAMQHADEGLLARSSGQASLAPRPAARLSVSTCSRRPAGSGR